ncbi:MAG: DUF2079 domain-containing protein [Phycisphaerales bacterium]|nr:MAG: DUF2079 domain-containing protein [Phycisphaerales bacterium]
MAPFALVVCLFGLIVAIGGRGHFVMLPTTAALVGAAVGKIALAWHHVGIGEGQTPDRPSSLWPFLFLMACIAAFAAACSTNLLGMYAAGHVGYFDTGTFASRLVNTLRWSAPFRENPSVPPFWDHLNPGFYVLTPLATITDPVRLLLVAQIVAAAATALVWYAYGRRCGLSPRGGAAVGLAWLLLPSLSQMAFSMGRGFHGVMLAVPLVAGSLLCMEKGRWVWMAILAALACSLRETVALAYAGIGLGLLSQGGRRKHGIVILAVSLAYFAVVVGAIIPAFRGGSSYLGEHRFEYLGGNIWEVLLSPLFRPAAFWGTVFSWQSLMFVLVVLASVALFPLWRGGWRWVAVLPGGVWLMLWEDPLLRSIAYHYHAVVLVLVFWIALSCVARPQQHHRAWALLGAAATASFLMGWWPQLRATTPLDRLASRADAVELVRSQVGDRDTVAATICMAAHCVQAAEVRVLSSFDPDVDGWPDVLVLDYADDWGRLNLPRYLRQVRSNHRRTLADGYAVAEERGPVAVLRPGGAVAVGAVRYVAAIPEGAALEVPVRLMPGLWLEGWRIREFQVAQPGRRYGRAYVDAYVRVESTPRIDMGIGLALVDAERGMKSVSASAVRPAGGMASSSLDWEPRRIVHEEHEMAWALPVPPERGRFKLRVDLYDLATGQQIASGLCD